MGDGRYGGWGIAGLHEQPRQKAVGRPDGQKYLQIRILTEEQPPRHVRGAGGEQVSTMTEACLVDAAAR